MKANWIQLLILLLLVSVMHAFVKPGETHSDWAMGGSLVHERMKAQVSRQDFLPDTVRAGLRPIEWKRLK